MYKFLAHFCMTAAILGLLSQQWMCALGLALAAGYWWGEARDAEADEAILED